MNVRRAIELLQQLPPDAEVMIDAPFDCSKSPILAETSSLRIPVRSLRTGIFYYPKASGSQWVCFMGTGAWGLDQGIEGRSPSAEPGDLDRAVRDGFINNEHMWHTDDDKVTRCMRCREVMRRGCSDVCPRAAVDLGAKDT